MEDYWGIKPRQTSEKKTYPLISGAGLRSGLVHTVQTEQMTLQLLLSLTLLLNFTPVLHNYSASGCANMLMVAHQYTTQSVHYQISPGKQKQRAATALKMCSCACKCPQLKLQKNIRITRCCCSDWAHNFDLKMKSKIEGNTSKQTSNACVFFSIEYDVLF